MELMTCKYRQQVARLVTVDSEQAKCNIQEQAKVGGHTEPVNNLVSRDDEES